MQTVIIPSEKTIIQIPDKVRPALCLDLDDTIRYSKSGKFINGPDDIVLFSNVEQKIWEYRNRGFLIFGITNQGGVAFGIKSPADHMAEIETTLALFDKNPFHIIKACFHHPKGKIEPYKHRSLLRKPQIGQLALCEVEAWKKGYIVEWARSIFVGDRPEDQECAKNADIVFVWADDFFERSGQSQT